MRPLRSVVALVVLAASFVAAGAIQRLVLWPLFLLRPSARYPVMDRFMHGMAAWVLFLVRAGGARLRRTGTIPTGSPVLVVMNHQSLLDIPTAICMCAPRVPLFVTRKLYARGIPMVSLMLRLREDPLVDPHQDRRGSVASLKLWVRRHERPVVLFPEGHRSRTGEVAPFQASGMRVILGERRVPVYLLVSDGFWACRRLSDFVFNMGSIDGRTEVLGPFEPPDSPGGLLDFVERMRGTLVAHLEAMRRADH